MMQPSLVYCDAGEGPPADTIGRIVSNFPYSGGQGIIYVGQQWEHFLS